MNTAIDNSRPTLKIWMTQQVMRKIMAIWAWCNTKAIFLSISSIKCLEFELTLINKSLLFPSYIYYKSTNQVVENLNEDKDLDRCKFYIYVSLWIEAILMWYVFCTISYYFKILSHSILYLLFAQYWQGNVRTNLAVKGSTLVLI